jgi:hypothetical protein
MRKSTIQLYQNKVKALQKLFFIDSQLSLLEHFFLLKNEKLKQQVKHLILENQEKLFFDQCILINVFYYQHAFSSKCVFFFALQLSLLSRG